MKAELFVAYSCQLEQAARHSHPGGCSQGQGDSKPELQEAAYEWQVAGVNVVSQVLCGFDNLRNSVGSRV